MQQDTIGHRTDQSVVAVIPAPRRPGDDESPAQPRGWRARRAARAAAHSAALDRIREEEAAARPVQDLPTVTARRVELERQVESMRKYTERLTNRVRIAVNVGAYDRARELQYTRLLARARLSEIDFRRHLVASAEERLRAAVVVDTTTLPPVTLSLN
jgi:hypothetical protein